MDGTKVGVSPLKPLSLRPGVHAIRLTHPDYDPYQREVSISPADTTKLQLDFTSVGIPRLGTLQLLIVPWAEVEVDGTKVGVSPLKPLSLPAGVHAIKLTHPDYRPYQRTVTIRRGETTKLQVDLTKEAFPK